jgi:hypothetical protein
MTPYMDGSYETVQDRFCPSGWMILNSTPRPMGRKSPAGGWFFFSHTMSHAMAMSM